MSNAVTSPIDAFAQTATEYCTIIENHEQFAQAEFLYRARELPPLLYYRALFLPDVEGADVKLGDEITHDQWQQVFELLQEHLGGLDLYWEIFDPVNKEPDHPVASSLSDDLADIWRDLKRGLQHWSNANDSTRDEVVWQWRFSFHHHWSRHAVDALRTINSLIEDHDIGGAKFGG